MWIFLAFALVFFMPPTKAASYVVKELIENEEVKCCDNLDKDLRVYCYKGTPKHLLHVWETVQLQMSLSTDEYHYYIAYSPEDVLSKFENDLTSWAVNLFAFKKKHIKLNPFNVTCVGISSTKNYTIKLNRIRIDYWKVLAFSIGFILFFSAPKLSSNSMFYYLTGISVGVVASNLIVIYMLSRLVPKKPVMYSFLAGGWTVGLYAAQLVWDNMRTIVLNYKSYVAYYALVSGIISFFVCYRIGPVTDPRSVNLIKWTLQAVALAIVFYSTDHEVGGMACVITIVAVYLTPFRIIFRPFRMLKCWWKPEQIKLLSEEEYYHQGAEETRKALDELRGYCSSPECNQWKTVLKLKHPIRCSDHCSCCIIVNRFAKFVQGTSHLDDSEILAFETDGNTNSREEDILTADSSDED